MKASSPQEQPQLIVNTFSSASRELESSHNYISLFNHEEQLQLHQTSEDNRIQLFVKQPNSPLLQSYALKNGQQLPSSTNLIGENYANRQREGPCSLALSCLKPKMPQKKLMFGSQGVHNHSSSSSSQSEERFQVEDMDTQKAQATHRHFASTGGARSHTSSPLKPGSPSGVHSKQESTVADGPQFLPTSPGGQSISNRQSLALHQQSYAQGHNAVTSPAKRLLLLRRNSSTSAISASLQHLVSPEKDKRAAEQEIQEKQQQQLVSLLGLGIKKKIEGMVAQHKQQQLQQMKKTQERQSVGQQKHSSAYNDKFNEFLQASLSPTNSNQLALSGSENTNSSPVQGQNGGGSNSGGQGMPLETLRIFQLFKVPMMKLKQIHTLEGKVEFLIEHAQSNIRDQLRTINQMEYERQENIKIFKKQMRDQFNDEHFQGLYSWLRVNSPGHEGLIKKLRTKLIESLQTQDFDEQPRSARFHPALRDSLHLSKVIRENPGTLLASGAILHEAVAKSFKPFIRQSLDAAEKQQLQATAKKGVPAEERAGQEKEVKKFKNLNDMMKDLDRETHELRRSKLRPKTSTAPSNKKAVTDEEGGVQNAQGNSRKDEVAKFFDTLPAQSWDDVREREKRQQMDQLLKQFSSEEQSALEKGKSKWTDRLERLFSSHKRDIRLGLTQYSSTGPWNKVVLGQMDQLRTDMPKNTTSQKDLQKAYSSLKYEKVHEIVNTIPSLNECLDKRLFQRNVNNLPKDQMNAIETQIAEDILWTYTRNKHNYQSARNKFFKERVITSCEKIKAHEDQFQAKAKSVQRKAHYSKLSKRYRTILNGLQKGTVSLKSPTKGHEQHIQSLYQQGLHHQFEPKALQMNIASKDPTSDYLSTRMALDQFQAVTRVNSQPKYDRAVPHKFFIEKYAGGPVSNTQRRKPVSLNDIVRAAVRIQSWARIVIARKVARDKKNEFDRQKFFYEENLKRQQEKLEREMFYRQSANQLQDSQTPRNLRASHFDSQFGGGANVAIFQTGSSYLHSSPSPKSKGSKGQLNHSLTQSQLLQNSLHSRTRIASASKRDLKAATDNGVFVSNKNLMVRHQNFLSGGPSSLTLQKLNSQNAGSANQTSAVLLSHQQLQIQSALGASALKANQSAINSRRASVGAKSQASAFKQNFSTTSKGMDLREGGDYGMGQMKEKTFKTPGQLRKNMQMVLDNMFQACKKGNWNYIDKNRERLTLEVLQNTRDQKGNTPLYVAVANKQLDTASYLLERGVLASARNENGNSALHRAFMNQHYEMIGLLQSRGGSLEALNDLNQTPLYFGSRVLTAKLGIQSKPVNFLTSKEAASKFSQEKTQLLVQRAKEVIEEDPAQFVEEGEDKESVIRGVAQRLGSKQMAKDFAPLYASAKHSKHLLL